MRVCLHPYVRREGPSLRSLIATEPAIPRLRYCGLVGTSNIGSFMSMVERGWAWPARSSPQPPEAEARRAWLEGAGHAHHNRQRDEGAGAAPGRGSCCAGFMVLSAVGWHRRNMASGEDRRPDVPNAVTAKAGRNGGNGIAGPRPGRDRFPSERDGVRTVRPPSCSSGTLVRPSTCGGGQPPASWRPRPWLCVRRSAWPAPRPTP
jgi:hypothetical protein